MNSQTLDYLRAHREETPKEIAAALAADYATAADLDRKSLAAYLLSAGLTSAFREARDNVAYPDPIRKGLWGLQDIIDSGIDYVETTRPEFGAQMTQLLGGLEQAGLADEKHVAELVALAGGYRYERLTEAEVTEALAAMDAEDAGTALRVRAAGAYNGVVAAVDGGERDWAVLVKVFGVGE